MGSASVACQHAHKLQYLPCRLQGTHHRAAPEIQFFHSCSQEACKVVQPKCLGHAKAERELVHDGGLLFLQVSQPAGPAVRAVRT